MKTFAFSHIFRFLFLFLTMLCPLHSYTETAVSTEEKTQPATEETDPLSESKENPALNENEMIEFLITEVIPAFEGLKHFHFNQPPSFHLHFTSSGIQLKECSFSFQIQQMGSIQYNLAQADLHDFQANAHIGKPESFLFFDISCGDQSAVINGYHFTADISIKDKNLEPSYYEITVHSLDQEQMKLKIKSINMDVKFQNDVKWILIDSENHGALVDSLKTHPHFLPEILEEKSTTDLYSIPYEVWPHRLPHEETVQVTKNQTSQIISVEGAVHFSFPISVNGQRQETESSIPIAGNIFVVEKESSEGQIETIYVPDIKILTQ